MRNIFFTVVVCCLLIASCRNKDIITNAGISTENNNDTPQIISLKIKDSIRINYDIVSETELDKEINGKSSDNINTVEMNVTYNIKKDTSTGDYNILLQYNGLKGKIKSDDDEKIVDAAADPSSDTYTPEDKILAVYRNARVYAIVSPEGIVKKISGASDIAHKMYELAGNDMQSNEMIKMIINKYASNGFFKNSIEKSFKVNKFKSMIPGDSWEENDTLQSDLKLPFKTICKLESITDGIATISVRSDIKMDNKQLEGQSAFVTLAGSQDGEVKVDVQTGLIYSNITTLEIEGDVFVRNVDVPIKIKKKSKTIGKVL